MANDRTHNAAPASLKKVAVWDLPLRIFHWTLALAVLGLIVTGTQGGNCSCVMPSSAISCSVCLRSG